MLRRIITVLIAVISLSGFAQKQVACVNDVFDKGAHAFTIINFEKEKTEKKSGDVIRTIPYAGHRSTVRDAYNSKKLSAAFGKGREEQILSVQSTDEHYIVEYTGSLITFRPENEDRATFVINCRTEELMFGDNKVRMQKEDVTVSSSENIFSSAWSGYLWKPVAGKGSDYHVKVAKLKSSGRVYIEIRTPATGRYRLLSV
ncbi:hypothetical protein [Sinomicrobium oceani]|uniref:hypothetical protein n=1 Tax=Sinomicrobium oceani TaxID=1150368 RepID=UPI00227B204F|nr:hypothetical protein [Sinomicrobium oceani]